MADYKKMYLHMAREVAKATEILIAAQKECEEIYIESDETVAIIEIQAVQNADKNT